MSFYALQASYTSLALSALTSAPVNRLEEVRPAIERLGGRIVNGWYSFGDYDVLIICQMPDIVSAAALSMALSAGGAVKAVKTTPLLTFEEGVEALRKARSAEYAAPPTEIPYFGVFQQSV
jgi:uncharacterized protein with GYD domain